MVKLRAIVKCTIPQLHLTFEVGQVREVMKEQAESLLATGNFEKVKDDTYEHREMRTRRKPL